jgi:hypothetical protein
MEIFVKRNYALESKKRFKEVALGLNRPGVDRLVEWLENETDFFLAPASRTHHGAFEGGLVHHSLNVMDAAEQMARVLFNLKCVSINLNSLILVALFHDVCKINLYKKIDEKWERTNRASLGHGEESLLMVQRFVDLTEEEQHAVRWHMGGFDHAVKGGEQSLGNSYEKFPVAVLLHLADMAATYLLDSEPKQLGQAEEK